MRPCFRPTGRWACRARTLAPSAGQPRHLPDSAQSDRCCPARLLSAHVRAGLGPPGWSPWLPELSARERWSAPWPPSPWTQTTTRWGPGGDQARAKMLRPSSRRSVFQSPSERWCSRIRPRSGALRSRGFLSFFRHGTDVRSDAYFTSQHLKAGKFGVPVTPGNLGGGPIIFVDFVQRRNGDRDASA